VFFLKKKLSFQEFIIGKDNYVGNIVKTVFAKYMRPCELRDSWSNFNFEKYKEKFIPDLVLIFRKVDESVFFDYYSINYREALVDLFRKHGWFFYPDLL